MTGLGVFKGSSILSLGVELELQLVNLHHLNLAMEAEDFLRRISARPHQGEIKPEITQAMIEINSSVHQTFPSLLSELNQLRDVIVAEAQCTHIGVCGGGTHPFQKWKEQRIFSTERFASLSEQYGYLAKQFTVFGQHIHIACPSGNDALYLCHALAQFVPQFIALSAASPFNQGVDTSFDCSRLAVISAFPLSGTPPWLESWEEFGNYFSKMEGLGIVQSMKDFYWDIRPKPEYGTVELRICDTPLTVHLAACLAAYAQALAAWLFDTRPKISQEIYLTYLINRFRAARYGLDAMLIDPKQQDHFPLSELILQTCEQLEPYAKELQSLDALHCIRSMTHTHINGANWLRERLQRLQSLTDVVRGQIELWRGDIGALLSQ